MFLRFLIFFSLVTVIEIYFLQAVKTFVQDFAPGKKTAILYTAYGFAALTLLIGIVSLFYPPQQWNNFFRFFSSAIIILVLCKLLGCVFLIVDDVFRLFRWFFSLFNNSTEEAINAAQGISRLKFLSQLAVTFTVIPAVGFIYGIVRGA
jgi:hypothetical protein